MVPKIPVDQPRRDAAVCERDRNVLIDAGAGTGKTTTVVRRLVHLLAPPDGTPPVGIERMAAITFTRRAAGELRLRIREQLLRSLADTDLTDQRRPLLRAALSGLDTACVGTIHSFADRLLRMRPVEAHLSPSYEIVEDEREILDEAFRLLLHGATYGTLATELAGTAAARLADQARDALVDAIRAGVRVDTEELEYAARDGLDALVAGMIRSRDRPPQHVPDPQPDLGALRAAIHEFSLLAGEVPGESGFARWLRHQAERMNRVREEDDPVLLFTEIAGPIDLKRGYKAKPQKRRDCDGDDDVWRAWKILHEGGPHRITGPTPLGDDLSGPLHRWFGRRLVAAAPAYRALYERVKAGHGVVDQIDLLLKLRNLLRDDKTVRGFYQGLFEHLFVDEFQDTDPLQAEIVLYLCERQPIADCWEDVELAPGRLTLVGDPKQSIYRFRRADVAMYESIRSKVAPGALSVELTANFRSMPSLIGFFNERLAAVLGRGPAGEVFDVASGRAFHRDLESGREGDAECCVHAVPFELAAGRGGVDQYRALEAVVTARYLRWLVERSGHEIADPADGRPRPVRYGDVCVLAIASTHLQRLFREMDALAIPHGYAGATLFLEDPLHRRFMLGLRGLADRDDGVAEAALMGPPFFAIDLADIVRWRAGGDGADEGPQRVRAAREMIGALRRRRFERSPGATARALLEQTGFGRRVAIGPNGAQRVERLRELCHLLDRIACEERLDYDATTYRVRQWIDTPEQIDAPMLVDGDAVRVMTVHQAKGLEFPVVVLWDGRASLKAHNTRPPWQVTRDGACWSMGLNNLGCSEPAGVDLAARELTYRHEERRRIVYVACTRARDLLVVPRAGEASDEYVCGKLLADGGRTGVRQLECFREGLGAPWADGIEPAAGPAVGDASEIEARVESQWSGALEAASRPRHQPVAVTAWSARAAGEPRDDETGRPAKDREGRFGAVFGTTVHEAIGRVVRAPGTSPEDAVRTAASRTGLAERLDEAVADVKRAIETLKQEKLLRPEGPNLQLEYPIAGAAPDGVVLEGSIDLIIVDDRTIHVVDFKTDRPPGKAEGPLGPYRRQVETYADLLTTSGLAAGRKVRPGLLYTADGVIRWL